MEAAHPVYKPTRMTETWVERWRLQTDQITLVEFALGFSLIRHEFYFHSVEAEV